MNMLSQFKISDSNFLQSHDPSEIFKFADLVLMKYFLLPSMLKTFVLLTIFVEYFLFQDYGK